MYDIDSTDQLITHLGGPTAIGEWLGISQEAVSLWKRRGLPPGWHFRIAARLRREGLSVNPEVFGCSPEDARELGLVPAA